MTVHLQDQAPKSQPSQSIQSKSIKDKINVAVLDVQNLNINIYKNIQGDI